MALGSQEIKVKIDASELEPIYEYVRALEERVMTLEAVVLKLTTKIDGYAIDYANRGEHKR